MEGEIAFWSFLHSVCNDKRLIHSRGSVWTHPQCDMSYMTNCGCLALKEIHWWPFCSAGSLYSTIQNFLHLVMCAFLAVLLPSSHMFFEPASHLVWRWLAAPAQFPSCSSLPFQQPPHSCNCLSIQALPSPTAVSVSCLLPLSASSLFSLLRRCCMGEINLKAANNWKPPSQMDHTLKQNLIEGVGVGWGLISLFGKSNCENRSPNACAFFYIYPLDGHHRNRWSDRTCGHNSSVCSKMRFFLFLL